MKHKTQFTVIEVPASGQSDWGNGAYTHGFFYTPDGNFLLKGYYGEVKSYAKTKFDRYFVRLVLYSRFGSRTITTFSDNCRLSYSAPCLRRSDYRTKFEVYPYDYHRNDNAIRLSFKRFPTKWIPEFDYMIARSIKKS